MEAKIITLAVLSYEKAQILKTLLDQASVECFLEDTNVIQGAISLGVKVKILETSLEQSMPILEGMLQKDNPSPKTTKVAAPETPRVLLPIDFSSYSKKAAVIALDWASLLNAEVVVFHTYYSPFINTMPFSESLTYDMNMDEMIMELEGKAKEGMADMMVYLNDLNDKLGDKKVQLKSMLIKGVAEEEILRFSEKYKPLVVIMGTRGKDKKMLDLVGSVTAEVMDQAKVPVLAIPEDFEYTGLHALKNIMYATDFQESDFDAIEGLEQLIRPLDMKIICAHVSKRQHSQWDDVKMNGLSTYLSNKYPQTTVVCDLVEHDDFVVGIENYLKLKQIDILCFTRKKRSLLSRLLNPNIAKKMLFHSTTPLLVFNH